MANTPVRRSRVRDLHPDVHPSGLIVLDDGRFTESQFIRYWDLGVPIVVKSVHKRLQGRWSPSDFIQGHNGSEKVAPINLITDTPLRTVVTVADFFGLLKVCDLRYGPLKLKVWSRLCNDRTWHVNASNRTGHLIPHSPKLSRSKTKLSRWPSLKHAQKWLLWMGFLTLHHIVPQMT